ncbi:MAG: septum site-determining protein MinC, partial [Burkholderiales bacterium]|nr:septum site-determining protein MinC [Burkholderiales bacterium]
FADAPELFDQDPVAIDLSLLREADEAIDFDALVTLLRRYKMQPIAAKAGSAAQMEAALAAGLTEAHGAAQASPPAPAAALAVVVEPPAAPRTALIIDKPLRSGQRVYAKGGDLIVLAVVSFGAEVIADGNIHVYAPLRGRALAGALGDTSARIFTTCMEAQLLSIAGIYRTTETELPAAVLGKTAQVRLDGEKLVVEALKF